MIKNLGLIKESVYETYIKQDNDKPLRKFVSLIKENKSMQEQYNFFDLIGNSYYSDTKVASKVLEENLDYFIENKPDFQYITEFKDVNTEVPVEKQKLYENLQILLENNKKTQKRIKKYHQAFNDVVSYITESKENVINESEEVTQDILDFSERFITDKYKNLLNEEQLRILNILIENNEQNIYKEYVYLKNLTKNKLEEDLEKGENKLIKESIDKIEKMPVDNSEMVVENIIKLANLLY